LIYVYGGPNFYLKSFTELIVSFMLVRSGKFFFLRKGIAEIAWNFIWQYNKKCNRLCD